MKIAAQTCSWSRKSTDLVHQSPEIFWINMDKSVERRQSLSMHLDQLGWLHRRIRGLSLDDIYIPGDIRSLWDQYDAKVQTTEALIGREDPKFVTKYGNASHFLVGLVGRGKTNRLKELGCTISHLEAMRQAIYNNRSSSKYAVITEDDIFIPFDVNFEMLAESAPKDFGILQLFNSNEESMLSVWKMYRRDQSSHLWVPNRVGQAASFWSTCAYLINREVMKPVIDAVIENVKNTYHVRIIAGIRKPCRPKISECCKHVAGTYSYEFQERPPCFIAPKGFQADSFLYTLNRTYVLTTPLITNGAGGNQSTFHQDHVESIHQAAFRQQRKLINEMISGSVARPSFANISCSDALPLQMELKTNNTCWYSAPHRRSLSIFWLYIAHTQAKEKLGDYIRNVVGREAKWFSWVGDETLYIPPDLLNHWETRQCRIQSTESRLQARTASSATASSLSGIMKEGYQVAFSGLCGRTRHHSSHVHTGKRDLSVTVSHLLAMYHARKSPLTQTQYAIISSDDVFLPLNPNFEGLVASAPPKFGFLTFLVDDANLMDRLWQEYVQKPKEKLWSLLNDKYVDTISSQFYIVNLDVVGPILESIVQLHIPGDNGRSLSILRLIAAGHHHNRPGKHRGGEADAATAGEGPADVGKAGGSACYPRECCSEDAADRIPPYCILSHGGNHRAESFLWKIAPTYTFHIPMVMRGSYDTSSGFIPSAAVPLVQMESNSSHEILDSKVDKSHKKSRHPRATGTASTGGVTTGHRQRQIINVIQEGQVSLPEFLLSSCSFRF